MIDLGTKLSVQPVHVRSFLVKRHVAWFGIVRREGVITVAVAKEELQQVPSVSAETYEQTVVNRVRDVGLKPRAVLITV